MDENIAIAYRIQNSLNRIFNLYRSFPQTFPTPSELVVMDASRFLIDEMGLHTKNAGRWKNKLPIVYKNVLTGARGGAYYVNGLGNKIWLKKHQRQQCRDGTLIGAGENCPTVIREYNKRCH